MDTDTPKAPNTIILNSIKPTTNKEMSSLFQPVDVVQIFNWFLQKKPMYKSCQRRLS